MLPKRPNSLTDKVEPKSAPSRNDMAEPTFNSPHTESELPRRLKLLSDSEEPNFRKSSTEREYTEPKRPSPRTETPLEQDAKEHRTRTRPSLAEISDTGSCAAASGVLLLVVASCC